MPLVARRGPVDTRSSCGISVVADLPQGRPGLSEPLTWVDDDEFMAERWSIKA
jgi:hypothetical protein